MKEMCKAKIYIKNSVKSVANERKFLEKFDFPLLCNMHYSFQDNDNLYLVLDYLSGGDLRYHFFDKPTFSEIETKFITICTILSLEYIHKKNIIHRDLKPENLVFDDIGYLHLTDFGISAEIKNNKNVTSTSGTPGYMAPEVLFSKAHDFCVDYYGLGVIIYELIMGERPYNGIEKKELKEEMISKKIQLKKENLPDGWVDTSVIDFVNKLLKRKKSKRLGKNGISEIKNHPWLKDVKWDDYVNKSIDSPFQFNSSENFNVEYANREDDESIYEGKKNCFIDLINQMGIYDDFYYNFEDNEFSSRNNSTSLTRYSSSKNNSKRILKSGSKKDDEDNLIIKRKRTKQYSIKKIRDFSNKKDVNDSIGQRKIARMRSSINVRKNNRRIN